MSEDGSTSTDFVPAVPGLEHELLKPFEGVFKATVKMWFGPGDPMVQTGIMTNTFQLGGFFLHQDFVGEPYGFLGKGYWGFSQTLKVYEGFWIDTASSAMQTESGNVDESGRIWTMQSKAVHPHTGGTLLRKSIIRLIDDNHYSADSFFTGEGQAEFKEMEIQFVRT